MAFYSVGQSAAGLRRALKGKATKRKERSLHISKYGIRNSARSRLIFIAAVCRLQFMSQFCELEVAQDARRDGAHVTLRYLDAPAPALCSPEELKAAGFTAVDLKEAGCNFSNIKSAGFNLRQLKDAGFQASLFKSDGCSVVQLMEAGFTARELRRAGFDFLSLKSAGFNLKQLKDAGFQASPFKSDGCSVAQLRQVGFTARELLHSSAQELEDFPKSEHHEEIQRQLLRKDEAANIFGQSWMSFLGFFAPFGTENSFWSRLKKSPTFKYIFVYDEHSVEQLGQAALSQELAVA